MTDLNHLYGLLDEIEEEARIVSEESYREGLGEGREEGYTKGFDEGYREGLEDGKQLQ